MIELKHTYLMQKCKNQRLTDEQMDIFFYNNVYHSDLTASPFVSVGLLTHGNEEYWITMPCLRLF